MVELPKNQYETQDDMGPYTVAARYCTTAPDNADTNSTLVDYNGQLIELFGITQEETQPLPHGYNMLATVIKKHINQKLRCIIVNLSDQDS